MGGREGGGEHQREREEKEREGAKTYKINSNVRITMSER
jgi:hypothetical protein